MEGGFFSIFAAYFFFFFLRGCPGQFARTTTNLTTHWISCKPSEHVRHRRSDRHAQWGSNPGAEEGNKPLQPLGQDFKWIFFFFFTAYFVCRGEHIFNFSSPFFFCYGYASPEEFFWWVRRLRKGFFRWRLQVGRRWWKWLDLVLWVWA
jgi:hypothetical protein